MKKELRPVHDMVRCDVCGRTILKGEQTEAFLAPGGHRHAVCELCFTRAAHHGWIRESAAGDVPTRMPREEPRRPLLGRLLARSPRTPRQHGPQTEEAPQSDGNGAHAPADPAVGGSHDEVGPWPDSGPSQYPRERSHTRRERRMDPRHVRAVPTTAEVKVQRAIELFNSSEHQRTVAGLVRTLGPPWAMAAVEEGAPSEVTIIVAWELSWYRFRVDLGDEADPVLLLEKGDELNQIDESLRDWNAAVEADGRLTTEVGAPG